MFGQAFNINYLEQVSDNNEHEFYFPQPPLDEIRPLYCGFQKCKPGHSFGPAMRDHFYYHFIVSGYGTVKNNQTTFQLTSGSGFFVFPNQVVYYQADVSTPWEYMWVAFSGTKATELISKSFLSPQVPIIQHTNPEKIQKLMNAIIFCAHDRSICSLLQSIGLLIVLLSEVTIDNNSKLKTVYSKEIPKTEEYLNKAIHFMKTSYAKDISISMIADRIGLDKSYFSRIFKERYGITPVVFLQKYRLSIAYYLLQRTNLSIKKISALVGFNDQLYFSKRFKHYYAKTPTEIREEACDSDN